MDGAEGAGKGTTSVTTIKGLFTPADPSFADTRTAEPSIFGRAATWNADKLWQRKPPAWAQASWAKAASR